MSWVDHDLPASCHSRFGIAFNIAAVNAKPEPLKLVGDAVTKRSAPNQGEHMEASSWLGRQPALGKRAGRRTAPYERSADASEAKAAFRSENAERTQSETVPPHNKQPAAEKEECFASETAGTVERPRGIRPRSLRQQNSFESISPCTGHAEGVCALDSILPSLCCASFFIRHSSPHSLHESFS